MENKELKRRNKLLATQVEKQKRIEDELMYRISQLEKKQSEDDFMLCGINRYWKLLDESCRIFTKQFDPKNNVDMFDKPADNGDSFLIQLSTWDIEELKEKLEKRAEISRENVKKMMTSFYKMLMKIRALQKLRESGVKLKSHEIKRFQQNIKFRRKIITLQQNYYTFNLRFKMKQDFLNIKETENDELRNRADNLQYQNTKTKGSADRMEHNLAELMDEIKTIEALNVETEADSPIIVETPVAVETDDKSLEVEKEIEKEKRLSEQHLQELQVLNIKQQEAVKQMETLKIDLRQLPEKVIIQSKKYKYLQSKFSILYNEATQLRLSWDEVQKQMQLLKSSFNATQETSERECLLQQKDIRQEMIKLDDTNGQLRKECQKLKMELEQSIAENNLFGSLNSEMKKLMSSMLDYCKQHESDIKRYKRKHEEIEEDIRFSKAMPPFKIKRDRLLQLVRYREFHRRRLKEKELLKDSCREKKPMKMSSSLSKDVVACESTTEKESKDIIATDAKDLINAKELQHIKDILGSKEVRAQTQTQTHVKDLFRKETTSASKHPKDALFSRDLSCYKDFVRPKDYLSKELTRSKEETHCELLSSKDFLHCKEMVRSSKETHQSNAKLTYSKEILRSKELLKERYLRDCSKMKLKEIRKETPAESERRPTEPTDTEGTAITLHSEKSEEQLDFGKTSPSPKNTAKETTTLLTLTTTTTTTATTETTETTATTGNTTTTTAGTTATTTPTTTTTTTATATATITTTTTATATATTEEVKITGIVNLDSDDSGHDEPKSKKLEENKYPNAVKENSCEEDAECVDSQMSEKTEFAKPENKDQQEMKKPAAPSSKRDIVVRKLKYQLKKIVDEKKDLNLLLGMYKNMNKTDEEKVQLMVSEQKLKMELEEVKRQMRRIEDSRYDDRKDLVDVVMTRKIKYLLAKRRRLQKKIEDARDSLLCGEMEITGQVWDELQAQNTRLHQLLREKDEENLKLMTERVKSNQLYNLSKEENESMMQHINFNNEKIEMKSEIIQKLEERELAYRNRLSYFEHELSIRKKACEMNHRKAVESAQNVANLKRQLEKYQKLVKEVQQIKTERSTTLEAKIQKNNVLLEEVTQLRKKVDRMKKFESVDTLEAILAEELREYKTMLTCPSCKVNTKDAVLIKCFHVYCLDCIKTRYETRQRKCPECCAPFGANDYHRLFLVN